jgi:RNA polymerase sigma factor (sigma-70 family)
MGTRVVERAWVLGRTKMVVMAGVGTTDGDVPMWIEGTGGASPGARRLDPAAAVLFRNHYLPMLRLACAVLGNRHDGEDVVQDAFAASSERLAGLPEDARPRYLRTAVMHACLKHKRRARATKRQPVRTRTSVATVEEQALAHDDRARVAAALDALSVRQRQCVALRYYEQLSDAEIAATLHLSEGSAKTHLRRALAALKQHLEVPR